MPLIIWMAAACIASALPLAWWGISSDRQISQRARQNLANYQPTLRQATLERSATDRFVLPLVRSVGRRLVRFTPVGWIESRNLALAKAGWTGRFTPEQILGAKILIPLIASLLLVPRLLRDFVVSDFVVSASLLGASFFVPDFLLRARADRRADAITLSLPDLLDQLTISVEAGLGFEAALARITATNPDQPLAQEFGRMLQDVQLGTRRVDALDAMAIRTQVDDLRTVVLTLRQAEALGVPLARSLRNVAGEMREKRRFRAEERAHRLPVLLIFPLGLCILPALFIVILGPALLRITEIF